MKELILAFGTVCIVLGITVIAEMGGEWNERDKAYMVGATMVAFAMGIVMILISIEI